MLPIGKASEVRCYHMLSYEKQDLDAYARIETVASTKQNIYADM